MVSGIQLATSSESPFPAARGHTVPTSSLRLSRPAPGVPVPPRPAGGNPPPPSPMMIGLAITVTVTARLPLTLPLSLRPESQCPGQPPWPPKGSLMKLRLAGQGSHGVKSHESRSNSSWKHHSEAQVVPRPVKVRRTRILCGGSGSDYWQ